MSGRKLLRENVENAASDGFGWNFLRMILARITKFYMLTENNRPRKAAGYDVMTSLAASCRLQNGIKCCTKVRKTRAASIEVYNSVTV